MRRGAGDALVASLPFLLEEFVFKLSLLLAQDGVFGLSLNLEKHPHRTLSMSVSLLPQQLLIVSSIYRHNINY